MKKKTESEALKEAIALLQNKRDQEATALKEQYHNTLESLKPINLIKNSFNNIISSPDLKTNLIDNAIGLTTGYLSKKVLVGSSNNPVKRILGSILQYAVAGIVASRTEGIKSTGENLIKRFLAYRAERVEKKQRLAQGEA